MKEVGQSEREGKNEEVRGRQREDGGVGPFHLPAANLGEINTKVSSQFTPPPAEPV
jgi:hypothetical protein